MRPVWEAQGRTENNQGLDVMPLVTASHQSCHSVIHVMTVLGPCVFSHKWINNVDLIRHTWTLATTYQYRHQLWPKSHDLVPHSSFSMSGLDIYIDTSPCLATYFYNQIIFYHLYLYFIFVHWLFHWSNYKNRLHLFYIGPQSYRHIVTVCDSYATLSHHWSNMVFSFNHSYPVHWLILSFTN